MAKCNEVFSTRLAATCIMLFAASGFFSTTLAADKIADELVVTVRKTEENVQDVPLQVTLFGEEDIERERLRTIDDVAQLTPSLQFDTGFWPSDTRVSIRGLFARAGRPSAAVLIDGIDAMSESFESSGGSALLNQRILDIKRIEVARGPQSALYGRGAFSGAINYVTRRPSQEWNSSIIVDIAEDNRYELQGSFGGPIVADKLAFRAMISNYELDGYYTNPNTGGGLGGGDSRGAGLAFEWTPSDDFSAYWNTTFSRDEFGPSPIVFIKANQFRVVQNDGFGNTTLIPDGTPADCPNPSSRATGDACLLVVSGGIKANESQLDIPPDPRSSTPKDYEGTDDETLRSSVILEWDVNENLAFRSATSYTDSDQSLSLDTTNVTGLPNNDIFAGQAIQSDAANQFSYEQFYQEFQLSGDNGGRSNWLIGLNGFWEDGSDLNNSRFWYRDTGVFGPCGGFFGPNPDCTFEDADIFNKFINRDTTSYSLFGLFAWDWTDNVKITIEGRLIRDEVKVSTNTSDIASDALGARNPSDPLLDYNYPGSPGFADKLSDTNFVPRASIDWFITEDIMVYASAAKGIKPPTYNTTDFSDPAINQVGKEELWTYEIGAKSQLADGSVILNGALFFNDYTDQQVRVQFDGLTLGDLPRSGAVNAGEVSVWGAEIDASWTPTDNWYLSASYAYTDGEFDEFLLADAGRVSIGNQAKSGNKQGDFTGRETPGNPDHALALLGKYQRQLTGDIEWYTQATAQYQGERWADVSNLVELDSYWLASAQVGLEHENWYVALYAENLFDDDTIQYAQEFVDFQQGFQLSTFSFPVAYFAYLPQPRTVGIKFQYRTP